VNIFTENMSAVPELKQKKIARDADLEKKAAEAAKKSTAVRGVFCLAIDDKK
jgi:hypothetical protein